MRGIILAGGTGSRLHPITLGTSKQLVPVYDKPMVYYPLSTLILAGIRDVLVITTPEDAAAFFRLLGGRLEFGISITYTVQASPDGLAQAFVLGRDHIGSESCRFSARRQHILRPGLGSQLGRFSEIDGGMIFAYRVADASAYGVVEFDDQMRAVSLEEKPKRPSSNYAVPGLYFYDNDVIAIAGGLQAIQSRRVRDHRRQPRIPGAEEAVGRGVAARHRLARHRNVRLAARRGQLRSHHRGAPRLKSGCPKKSPGGEAFVTTTNCASAAFDSSNRGMGRTCSGFWTSSRSLSSPLSKSRLGGRANAKRGPHPSGRLGTWRRSPVHLELANSAGTAVDIAEAFLT